MASNDPLVRLIWKAILGGGRTSIKTKCRRLSFIIIPIGIFMALNEIAVKVGFIDPKSTRQEAKVEAKSPVAPKKVEQVQQVRSEPKPQAPSPWAEQKTQSQPQTQPLKTYSADTSEGIVVKRPDTSNTNIPLADLKFNEGLAVFEDTSTGLKGYVDSNGKVVVKPQFAAAGGFYQGRAVVKNTQEEWGYIDKSGNWVISPKFCSAARFSEGLAGVYVGGVRDENGDCVQGKWGFISVTGKMVIAPQFDKIWRFEKTKNSSAKAKVVLDGYTGYINSKGEWVD